MHPENSFVFVVDDDRSVRDSLRRLITSVGMTAEVFPTAQAFLEAPRGDAPGCLVLDVRLPGLSGLDLQRELSRTDVSLPIVFLTGGRPELGAPEAAWAPFDAQGFMYVAERGATTGMPSAAIRSCPWWVCPLRGAPKRASGPP